MNLCDVFTAMTHHHSKKLKLEEALVPILPDELTDDLPLIDVYTATIKDPKHISKIVVTLNAAIPIQELIHLKRIKGTKVLLFPKENIQPDGVAEILREKKLELSYFEDDFEVVAVAKIPPKVRQQYTKVHKLWPCNFHANSNWEKLTTNTLFSPTELDQHRKFMQIAVEMGKIVKVRHSSLVVDPKTNTVVAFGYDQSSTGPNKHSVMVAIDNVAKTQGGGVWSQHPLDQVIERTIRERFGMKFGYSQSDEGPYLCTGYSIYTTREPCITCAMALVHSRAKRVFFGVKQPEGALGSLCKIHVVESLNHHYEAFAGLLENECNNLSHQFMQKLKYTIEK